MEKNYGRIALIPKGDYDSETQYDTGDVVTYENASYICKLRPDIGTLPADKAYWQVAANANSAANSATSAASAANAAAEAANSAASEAKTATENANTATANANSAANSATSAASAANAAASSVYTDRNYTLLVTDEGAVQFVYDEED